MKTVLLFAALLFSVTADAGWLYKDKCYADTTTALAAFRAQFPFFSAEATGANVTADMYQFFEYASSTISTGGLVSEQIAWKKMSTGTVTSGVAATSQLSSCDSTLVATGNDQLMLAILATVFLFVLGFRVGGNMSNPKGGLT